MANNDEETSRKLTEHGAEPDSPQSRVPELRSPSEAEPEAGPAQPSAGEPAAVRDAPAETTARQQPAPSRAKPRSLFPALAVTALAGALLGIGGSFALRSFEAPQATPATPNAEVSDERIGDLSARIDALEKLENNSQAASAAARDAVAALESRLAAAENAAVKATETAELARTDAQNADARTPPEEAGGASQAQPADLGPIEARLASLEQKLTSIEQTPGGQKAQTRAEPGRESSEAKQSSRAQAVAVVAESLLRKLESGGQFSGEMTALEGLGVAQNSLAQLRAVPGFSVVSEHQLAAQFKALAPKMVASESAGQAGGHETFLDELARTAKGLVHIHRTGDAGGSGVENLATRIETALGEHDLEAAVNAWQELPAPAKEVSQGWGQAAKARLDALQAARAIEADAIASIGKPKS